MDPMSFVSEADAVAAFTFLLCMTVSWGKRENQCDYH